MFRIVACASASAALIASSELIVELPTSSMIFVTATLREARGPHELGLFKLWRGPAIR